MALTRRFLSALGIEAEKIDEIITAHTETIDGLKAERDKAKADAAKLPEVQAELEALKEKAGGEFREKYEHLKAEHEKYKADVEAEKELSAKKAAYKQLCEDASLDKYGIEKAMKYADWSKVELDEKGNIKNGADHKKAVSEEWARFVKKTATYGANTPNPPPSSGAEPKPKSRAAELYQQHYQMLYGVNPEERKGAETQ